jgi:hypothetical protein
VLDVSDMQFLRISEGTPGASIGPGAASFTMEVIFDRSGRAVSADWAQPSK